ncbi:MAG TPA: lysylphosphatidylglycerol synthase transmembrane domain-containing protein [Thermoguttaceae bacterium]|nr:lysylphosphatidylglycerol synthase transmembrane domain-containing protein [Thermoguttaceae bacterium]
MRRFSILLLKIAVSLAIIGFLVWQARHDNTFANLRDQPKQWGMLVAAWFFCAAAVLTTIVRWHFLVRAVEIPARLTESLRIGFLGYMFNLAPTGIVAGDAVKAIMLARAHENSRARSIASVVVDRLIGLYVLFIVATAAIWLTGFWRIEDPMITQIRSATYWVTAIGAAGIVALMIPAVTDGKLVRAMEQWPRVGRVIASLVDAMRMYRRRPGVLLAAAVMSVAVHSLFAAGIYCIARGLPASNMHSLGNHFVMSPLSSSTGVLPLPFGPFELVLDLLYAHVPIDGIPLPKGQGLVVALCYRIITVLIAAIGAFYFIGSRQEVARSIREAGDEEPIAPGSTIAMRRRCDPASAA